MLNNNSLISKGLENKTYFLLCKILRSGFLNKPLKQRSLTLYFGCLFRTKVRLYTINEIYYTMECSDRFYSTLKTDICSSENGETSLSVKYKCKLQRWLSHCRRNSNTGCCQKYWKFAAKNQYSL